MLRLTDEEEPVREVDWRVYELEPPEAEGVRLVEVEPAVRRTTSSLPVRPLPDVRTAPDWVVPVRPVTTRAEELPVLTSVRRVLLSVVRPDVTPVREEAVAVACGRGVTLLPVGRVEAPAEVR